jgi:hypothetical protein
MAEVYDMKDAREAVGAPKAAQSDDPKSTAKPRNHGTYEVWHHGNIHALDVESVAVHKVDELTKRPRRHWMDHPAVTERIAEPRPTRLGDVIVDPTCGAWEVQQDGYLAVAPPARVAERMAREGIVPQHIELLQAWSQDMLESLGEYDRILRETSERAATSSHDKSNNSPER